MYFFTDSCRTLQVKYILYCTAYYNIKTFRIHINMSSGVVYCKCSNCLNYKNYTVYTLGQNNLLLRKKTEPVTDGANATG